LTGRGSAKTLWEWLQLLIVPIALTGIGFWLTGQQDTRQQALEKQRANREQELADQRVQNEALQAYLDQMTDLILDRKLLKAEEGDSVYSLAQARTATVIAQLDEEHNRSVTRFLTDTGLTGAGDSSISLFKGIELKRAQLDGAFLSDADLDFADLYFANLSEADLSDAYLSDVNLSEANLYRADLRDTTCDGIDLRGADLNEADLRGARPITNEKLDRQARYLGGATMPNGQKYEDWLKDREGRGEDGDNE
jgi:uncharacterized protein YjbI with pentapeptide repeats